MLPAQMSHGKPRGGGAAAPPTTLEAQARGPAQPEPGDQSRGSRSMHPASACSLTCLGRRCRPTVECYYPGPLIAHRRLPRLPGTALHGLAASWEDERFVN